MLTQRPVDLQSAMQIAEQVGSTLATATHADKRGTKRPEAEPVAVKSGAHSGFVPMELGGASLFCGRCHNCGQFGHKAAQCSKRPTPVATNRHSNS